MKMKASEVFGIDWCNLDQVCKLARKFGPGVSVIKSPWRANYNIIHTVNENRDMESRVLYRTRARRGTRNGLKCEEKEAL